MSWARFDDQFNAHPKVLEAGPLAVTLHMHAIIYCAQYLTDGVVKRRALNRIVNWDDDADDFGETGPPNNRELAKRLVHAGLWDEAPDGDGWVVHDYLDFNPSREDVLAGRKKEADRKAAWRAKKDKGGKTVSRTCPAGTDPGTSTDVPLGQTRDSQRPSRGDSALPDPTRPHIREREREPQSTVVHRISTTEHMILADLQAEGFTRFGSLGGRYVARMARLCPVARWEWDAVLATDGESWPYAAKVLEGIRQESAKPQPPPTSVGPRQARRFADVTAKALEWAHAADAADESNGVHRADDSPA